MRLRLFFAASTLLATVILVAAPTCRTASAQDDLPAGIERADTWFEFSKEFSVHLQQSGRVREAVEEIFACGTLRPSDIDILADGAVLFVEYGSRQKGGIKPGTEYQRIADDMIRAAIARGGKGDPRLAYAIGRLKFAAVDWGTA